VNDLPRSPPADVAHRLGQMVRMVRHAHAIPVLLTLTPIARTNVLALAPSRVRAMNEDIRRLGAARNVQVIDTYSALAGTPLLAADGIHLTDAGYAAWAGAVTGALAHASASELSSALQAPAVLVSRSVPDASSAPRPRRQRGTCPADVQGRRLSPRPLPGFARGRSSQDSLHVPEPLLLVASNGPSGASLLIHQPENRPWSTGVLR
jgi:hypothetical protein